MPYSFLPGTNIQLDLQSGLDYRRTFEAAFAITGGIYLSQLSDMVGVPGATLQNWIKRGFVSSPVNKRYTRRQTCRIILIAMLRHSLQLDDVVTLLRSINNNLADEQDDLIDDSDLYLYFCDVVFSRPSIDIQASAALSGRISEVTGHFAMANPNCRPEDLERLNRALLIIVLAFGAWQLQIKALANLEIIKRKENRKND